MDFERLVAVVNPNSSQIESVSARVNHIREAFPVAYTEIETSPNSEETTDRIAETVQDGDIVLVCGGDGTVHDCITAGVPILPLWGGNGNDLAHIANGVPDHHNPADILRHGKAVPINPLDITLAGMTRFYAGLYTGYGATAEGAQKLNQAHYRGRPGYRFAPVRFGYEAVTLGPTGLLAKQFTVHHKEGDDHKAIDLTIANGSRMAKVGRPPVQLERPGALMFDCRSKLQVPMWAGSLALGTISGKEVTPEQPVAFSFDRDVLGHVDAEPFMVEAEQTVEVAVSPKAFFVVTTKLDQ